jgi:hypothetical protein
MHLKSQITDKQKAIPSVNCVYPTVAVYNTSFEANFGDNPAKPFKFDIAKCPDLILE